MHIRPATSFDCDALIAIDTVAPRDRHRREWIAKWIGDRACYMVEIDGEAAGYAVLHYHFFDCGFMEILMVGEAFRREGLGLRLIDHLKSICARPKLFTSTNRSNMAMQSLLKTAGFKESGTIDNLDEGDPELVFFWPRPQS